MLRWSGFLLVLGLVAVAGCGGQDTSAKDPQTPNKAGSPAAKRKGPDRTTNRPKKDKAKPQLVRVVFLAQPITGGKRKIQSVLIEGAPPNKKHTGPYRITNLAAVEGTLPAEGVYYLSKSVATYPLTKGREEQVLQIPEDGAFFDKKLPAGTLITEVNLVGRCKVDVEGWIDNNNEKGLKSLPFNVYVGAYEKR